MKSRLAIKFPTPDEWDQIRVVCWGGMLKLRFDWYTRADERQPQDLGTDYRLYRFTRPREKVNSEGFALL